MSIECNNTTPIASKGSAALTLTSAALNDILDVATLVDLSDPLDSLNRASVMNITNALANIAEQTDLSAYATLNARVAIGAPSYTEIADFLLSNNSNVAEIEQAIVDYNTGLLGGSSTILTNSPNISVNTAGISSTSNIDLSSSSSTTSSTATGGAPGDALSNLNNNSAGSSNNNSATSFDTGSGNSTVIGSSSDSSSISSNNNALNNDGSASSSSNNALNSNASNNDGSSSSSSSNSNASNNNGLSSNSNVASNFNTGSGNSTVIGSSNASSDFDSSFGSQSRTDTSGLTQIEKAALLSGGLTALVPAVVTRVFNDLDFHLDVNVGNSISSGLCNQFNSTLGKLSTAMLVVNAGKNSVTDIVNLTEKDTKKLVESIVQVGILKTLLGLLESIIDKLLAKVKQSMNSAVGAGTSAVASLGSAAKSLQKKLGRMARDIEAFTSATNLADLKTAIEAFIAKAASSFERLTPENIALLMFRLCQFTESLQSIMMAPAVKMNKLANQVETEVKALTSLEKTNTKEAVKYGAIRVSNDDKKVKKDSIIAQSKSIKPSERNVVYITSREPTESEISLVRDISESGLGQNITFSSSVISDEGWQDIDTSVWYKLLRLQEQTRYSYVVKQAATKRTNNKSSLGGTSKNAHNSGYAIDINVSSDMRDDTIVAASRAGFTGIGVYDTHIHLDNGNRRSWSKSTTTDDLTILFDAHNVDGFRKKRSI